MTFIAVKTQDVLDVYGVTNEELFTAGMDPEMARRLEENSGSGSTLGDLATFADLVWRITGKFIHISDLVEYVFEINVDLGNRHHFYITQSGDWFPEPTGE